MLRILSFSPSLFLVTTQCVAHTATASYAPCAVAATASPSDA
jgi:hypothetical protein